MKLDYLIGAVVAVLLSTWASFLFLRSSITGAPPLYSRGLFRRILHFAAGIIFALLALGIALKIAGEW